MPINFPNSPALNEVYTVDQKSWRYNGTAWNVISSGYDLSTSPSFTNLVVAGQSTVVADTATDTLTLVAGSGIAITTNASTDTVTLTSVASTGNITIVDTTLSVTNANPITITPNLVLGGTLRFPDNTVQTTATVQGPAGPAGPPGSSGTGSGNVNSVLGSYVDNAIVRYSGTSGTTIKNSSASISDAGLLTATNFSGGGASITALNATQLTTGTIPDARFPAILPISSGSNLTALNATQLTTGTVPIGRIGAAGTPSASTYLRGDNSWATVAGGGGTASDSFATIAVAGQSSVVADSSTDTLTLAAGTGITLTTDASTDTITITNSGSSQNAFGILAVAGQSSVEAESPGDTITLVAGTGISLATNAGTDTVTITSTVSAGATAFTGLSDRADLTIDQFYLQAITRLNVTNNGASAYRFDQYGTTDDPTIYAINGTTIAFNLQATGHPFLIQNNAGVNYDIGLVHVTTGGTVTTGSSAQGKDSGTLYWKIPDSISGNYRYQCSAHAAMVGTIVIKNFSSI
jgi:hypothetical protein